jgi:CheY-like chemotaxis protein
MQILVADDHEVVRKGVRAILTSHFQGVECIEATKGQEAISKALAIHPDIVILDINMPVLGGFGPAKEIQCSLPRSAGICGKGPRWRRPDSGSRSSTTQRDVLLSHSCTLDLL